MNEEYKIDIRLNDNSLVLTSESMAISYCNSLDRQLVKAIYQLQQENQQLKDNWNELKCILKEMYIHTQYTGYLDIIHKMEILDKVKELEDSEVNE